MFQTHWFRFPHVYFAFLVPDQNLRPFQPAIHEFPTCFVTGIQWSTSPLGFSFNRFLRSENGKITSHHWACSHHRLGTRPKPHGPATLLLRGQEMRHVEAFGVPKAPNVKEILHGTAGAGHLRQRTWGWEKRGFP